MSVSLPSLSRRFPTGVIFFFHVMYFTHFLLFLIRSFWTLAPNTVFDRGKRFFLLVVPPPSPSYV